ncbi:transporter substrate-binding domain-containing protein [Rhizobium lusitanum]|uniref:transporter substrate-binding domain-containing protein n=1 Tax=Rhizobium lusitanum TaxID=293958 RepID=UPI0019598FCD|nr:transporter substrate-binding domain-containing protein [Rhizobium lusitanum]MBM7044664.1 transporter substrate-binding domain-containing protein [Rhizobium lusitanum]
MEPDTANAIGATDNSSGDREAIRRELTSTGALRAGVIVAPALSAVFATFDGETGHYRGTTIDMAQALALQLGVTLEIVNFPNSGACTDALESGQIDVSFMPVDDERRKRVAFGPAYYILESTYLVTGSSGITSLAGVDREDVRVVGIANTTTIRSSARTLTKTTPAPAESIAEAVERMLTGKADALALSRDAFQTLLPQLPGARVLDGGFQSTGIAIAVGPGKPSALSCVSVFMDAAKKSGLVRHALDDAGFANEPVAPLSR